MDRRFLCAGQRLHKLPVDLLRQGAVDVIRRPPVVAGGKPGLRHINALRRDKRRSSVEEIQILPLPEIRRDGVRQRVRGQGPRRDDHRRLPGPRSPRQGTTVMFGWIADFLRHHARKSRSGRLPAQPPASTRVASAHCQDQAPRPGAAPLSKAPRHFPAGRPASELEQTSSAKSGAVMRRASSFCGFISCSATRDAALGQLPGGLAAGQARADYFDTSPCLIPVFSFACAALRRLSWWLSGFFAAGFFAAVLLCAGFLAAGFLRPSFDAADFFAARFFAAGFAALFSAVFAADLCLFSARISGSASSAASASLSAVAALVEDAFRDSRACPPAGSSTHFPG